MHSIVRGLRAKLPDRLQAEMKRAFFYYQIRRGSFVTTEQEFDLLPELVSDGDWVLDIGANVGHYSARLSDLVGGEGRVIAFEPVPQTCAILAANVSILSHCNVTVLNLAASDAAKRVSMSVPAFPSGASNYYRAQIEGGVGDINVLSIAVDSLRLDHRIRLVKIDVEGHELAAINGMIELLERDKPALIIETESEEVASRIRGLGYVGKRLPSSPNLLFEHQAESAALSNVRANE